MGLLSRLLILMSIGVLAGALKNLSPLYLANYLRGVFLKKLYLELIGCIFLNFVIQEKSMCGYYLSRTPGNSTSFFLLRNIFLAQYSVQG
jgi:hypothetical protein